VRGGVWIQVGIENGELTKEPRRIKKGYGLHGAYLGDAVGFESERGRGLGQILALSRVIFG
jgi:hypothetical protein